MSITFLSAICPYKHKSILTYFNPIHPNLHFTAETEQNNAINYLDISIHKIEQNIQTAIYRKFTFTHTISLTHRTIPLNINKCH